MEWSGHSEKELWQYREVILKNVPVLEVFKEYGIPVEHRETGLFTHRAKCPVHKGKNGGTERTPSLMINGTANNFYCFGCGLNSILDMISSINATPKVVVLEQLAKKIGLIDKNGNFDELVLSQVDESLLGPRETIEPHIFEISHLIRGHIKQFVGKDNFDRELKWAEKVGKKADEFLKNIGHEDVEYASELVSKIKRSIEKRSGK